VLYFRLSESSSKSKIVPFEEVEPAAAQDYSKRDDRGSGDDSKSTESSSANASNPDVCRCYILGTDDVLQQQRNLERWWGRPLKWQASRSVEIGRASNAPKASSQLGPQRQQSSSLPIDEVHNWVPGGVLWMITCDANRLEQKKHQHSAAGLGPRLIERHQEAFDSLLPRLTDSLTISLQERQFLLNPQSSALLFSTKGPFPFVHVLGLSLFSLEGLTGAFSQSCWLKVPTM
jgi:hypothetical protein